MTPKDVWHLSEKQQQEMDDAEAKIEVASWFANAQLHHVTGINLYYPPNAKEWERVVQPVTVYGIETNLLLYDNHLYQTRSGSGDCEMNLYHLGKCKGEK